MPNARASRIITSAASLVLTATLLTAEGHPGRPTTASAQPSGSAAAVSRVLAISVDGLNPRAITRLGPSRAPAFHRLMREGAWTFNARTAWGQTRTLPNHTGMLTGRRIDRQRGGHGVHFNRDRGRTVQRAAGHYVSSVYDVVHDRGGSTALYSGKTKFRFFERTWNTHGGPDRVGRNDGRAKIDDVNLIPNNNRLVQKLNADLVTSPRTFTFLHLSLPDSAGHRHGFMGPSYLKAVQETDRLLGTVLGTVDAQPALRDHLVVLLNADHGGDGSGHKDPTKLQNFRIPFMAWGAGVPAGRDLYTLNPTFRDPGSRRSGYRGLQPIRNGDLGNLVTAVLRLPAIPGSEFNNPQTLTIF